MRLIVSVVEVTALSLQEVSIVIKGRPVWSGFLFIGLPYVEGNSAAHNYNSLCIITFKDSLLFFNRNFFPSFEHTLHFPHVSVRSRASGSHEPFNELLV